MKATAILATVLSLGCLAAAPAARAQNYPAPSYWYAISPDHPKTWVDGAMRVHQDLRWSRAEHVLLADVTYSTRDYADNTHPTEEDNFALRLPTVHFDKASGRFTAHGVTVATLRPSFFGDHVVLAPNVQLSIHRQHGVITGALIPGNSD